MARALERSENSEPAGIAEIPSKHLPDTAPKRDNPRTEFEGLVRDRK